MSKKFFGFASRAAVASVLVTALAMSTSATAHRHDDVVSTKVIREMPPICPVVLDCNGSQISR